MIPPLTCVSLNKIFDISAPETHWQNENSNIVLCIKKAQQEVQPELRHY